MANAAAGRLPDHMLDEVWMIMHMVAEMGAHPEVEKASEKKFMFECDIGDDELEDAIEADSACERDEKEKVMIETAEKLARMGDSLDKEAQQKALENDIANYLKEIAKDIDKNYGGQLGRLRPTDLIVKSGFLDSVYKYYQTKVLDFLGLGQSFDKIAAVTHLTKGVAGALKDNSSHTVHLVSTLGSRFIVENYGGMIKEKGGLTKMVSQADSS